MLESKLFSNGKIKFFSIYNQRWETTFCVSSRELAAMSSKEREVISKFQEELDVTKKEGNY